MIYREHYISKIREFYDSDLIKIITGIRRSGKSVILEQLKNEIQNKSNNIITLNFEDKRVLNMIENGDALIEYIEKNKKKGKCYIFLDEVQMLDDWQNACKTLRLYDNSIFITGSNSKLLAKEFTKELSGRYVSFRVRPFVYKEILEYTKELGKECTITDYLVWGGFPKRLEFNSTDATIRYLNDLINRYRIKKEKLFKDLVNFVLKSNSRIISAKSIHKYIKDKHETCSINTIIKYLSYLEEAYIVETIKQYSTKAKKELAYYLKIYNSDVALNSIRCIDNRYDLTHNLENIVYNELINMDYNVNVYNNKGKKLISYHKKIIKNIIFKLHIV